MMKSRGRGDKQEDSRKAGLVIHTHRYLSTSTSWLIYRAKEEEHSLALGSESEVSHHFQAKLWSSMDPFAVPGFNPPGVPILRTLQRFPN